MKKIKKFEEKAATRKSLAISFKEVMSDMRKPTSGFMSGSYENKNDNRFLATPNM